MSYWWVRFKVGGSGFVEAATADDAMKIGSEKTGREAVAAETLPYPATPILHQVNDCPAFCYKPNTCAGKTACPGRIACSE